MQEVIGSTPLSSTSFYVLLCLHNLFGRKRKIFVGHTADLDDRIFRHTNSGSKSTKKAGDWKLVYREEYATKSEAYKREIEIKKKKSRKYIDWLINSVPERSV